MASNGKSLTTEVMRLDDTFDFDMSRPNSDKRARRYDFRNPYCAVSLKSKQIISQGRFGDLIFVSKENNEYQSWRKFCGIHSGHRICITWC
jgi:hypothetical protein